MKRAFCYTAIFFLLITIGFWAAFQFDAVQNVAKTRLSTVLQEKTGYKIEVGTFSGAMPFMFGVEDVKVAHPDIGRFSAKSIYVIPSWFEILFGRFSLLYCSIDGLDLRDLDIKEAETVAKACLPKVHLGIHSLHASAIQIPQIYSNPLITNYGEQSHVDCFFSLAGGISWHPGREELSLTAYISPHIGDLSPGSIDVDLTLREEKSSLNGSVVLLKTPEGSPFVSLFCDKITFDFDLEGDLFQKTSPFVTGSWSLSGLKKQKQGLSLNPVIRFSANGKLHAPNRDELHIALEEMQAQKIEPLLSYHMSKKKQISEELLLADSEEPQDASTLSRITPIPLPNNLKASFTREENRIAVALISSDITIGSEHIPSCSLRCSFDTACSGDVNLDATLLYENRQLPICLSFATSMLENGHVALKNIEASIAGLLLKGACDVALEPFALNGSIQSDPNSVDPFLEQFSAKAKSLELSLTSTPETASLGLSCEKFVHPEISCAQFGCKITQSDKIDSYVTIDKLVSTNLAIHNATVKSSNEKFSIDLAGKSKNGDFSSLASGSFSKNSCTFESMQSRLLGHEVALLEPFTITYHNSLFTISPFAFTREGKTFLQGELVMKKSSNVATITVSDLPLECFDPFLQDVTLFGNISGRFELSGTKTSPIIALTCASSSLQLWNPKLFDAPPLAASCEVTMKDDLLQAALEIEGLSLRKPTHLSLTKDKNKLSGKVEAEFDLATLLSSYLDEDELVEGIVSLDVGLSGTKDAPVWKGKLDIHQGKIFVPCLGTSFSDVEVHGSLKDNQLLIEKAAAKDDEAGTFTATGYLKNLLNKRFEYRIDGKASNFATIILPEAEAKATGDLTVTGNLKEANFIASMDVEDAKFYLSPASSKDIPKLDIIYVGEDHAPAKKPFKIGLDLLLKMNEGQVVGMGLDSTWKGDAHVTGQNKNIDVQGNILLSKGILEFAGKRFTLTQGALTFAGDLLKQSNLQVIASNDVGAISTQIALQGPLANPRIVIQSNPAMSQKEILSWLLFNKSSSDITPMQGIQLGQSLLKLKSGNNSVDLIEELKQKLSIDRIDFGQASTTRPTLQDSIPNEVSVQVGKYISDGVIVTLSKDVTNEVNRVGVEANLTKHITAQANVGDDANAELSLEWKLRY